MNSKNTNTLLTQPETLKETIDCLVQNVPLSINQFITGGKSYKTTNKNPIIRLLFIGISFILVNIWINLLWKKVSKPRRGRRLIYHCLFTFKQVLSFLRHSIDEIYQIVDRVYSPSG